MALLASANVQLLSEKWRRTVVLVTMILCFTALSVTAIMMFAREEYFGVAVGTLVILGRRALGLKGKDEKQLTEQVKKLEEQP